MQITIQKAKNGEETAVVNGHFLHSSYAPQKEAQRFAETLELTYEPCCIIITEPALSYCADFLRKRFPNIKIGAIRYCKDFFQYNSHFDFVLNFFEHSDFENYLESCLNEEELLKTYFISWKPSSAVFGEIDKLVWDSIKKSLERAKTLLITRQYFEKKWFLNSCNLVSKIKNVQTFNYPVNFDVLIIASGPSLKSKINFIKENQNKFFIICLSSAISVCYANQIIPDLCISTDGGFWAGEHLKKLEKTNVVPALACESFCKTSLLQKLQILPLTYNEGISSEIFKAADLKSTKIERNGTVSGTALMFAIQYFTKNIYFCGLDLACAKGFQHTQPNELEQNAAIKDNRIFSKEKRIAASGLNSQSLEIYKNWFCNNEVKMQGRKVFRIIEENERKNNLIWIQDINQNELKKLCEKNQKIGASEKAKLFSKIDYCINRKKILELLNDNCVAENWKKLLFPLDYVLLSHNPKNIETKQKINLEWEKLKNKAQEVFDEDL